MCSMGTSWAVSESITWSGGSLTGVSGTNVTAGAATAVNGTTYKAGTISISSNKIQTESKKHTNDSYWEDFSSGTQNATSTNATNTARIEFPLTIADGCSINISEVDFTFEQGGGGGPAVHVFMVQESASTWIGYTTAGAKEYKDLDINLTSGSAKLVFVLGVASNLNNGRQFKLSGIEIKGTSVSSAPTISASDASITATESGVEVTEDITVSGANLTGSTLTATLSPAVTGLSVTLASNSISDGSISTTAKLHYTQTENASGNTTLTLSDGTTSKDITITYSASILTSSAIVFSLTDEKGVAEVTADNATVTAGISLVMSDSKGRIKLTPASGMKFRNGDIIVIKGTVGTTEDKKKPFGIDIYDSSDTKKGTIKYGEDVWSGDGELEVSGKLFLTTDQDYIKIARNGGTTTTLTLCEITRTISDPFPLTITPAGWASMYLDFPAKVPSGVTAYYASSENISGNTVTLTAIETGATIPANTGVIVKGDEYTYNFAYSSATPVSVSKNILTGTTTAISTPSGAYVLSGATTPANCVFAPFSGETLAAYKAYIAAGSVPTSAPSIRFVIAEENNATALENTKSDVETVKFVENGKLLIKKNGVVYDVMGRVMR